MFLLTSRRFASGSAQMEWLQFFRLRKQNRVFNIGCSALTGFGGALATLGYLSNVEVDVEKPIFGLDPIMVLGGTVAIGGALGYQLGPFFGNTLFNLKNRALLSKFRAREQVFLQRVKHYRVDPSSQSFSNPVPDYYGERIYSVKSYKQWLQDCNAFRRKSKEFL